MAKTPDAPKALISVFHKEELEPLAQALVDKGYTLLSTGGTRDYLQKAGFQVEAVEELTGYPSILGGRVKTLHPKIFGGILNRRHSAPDQQEMEQFMLPMIDVVVVDLYPFSATVESGASHEDIIEKIDIGGISLIRAAAKNYSHCWIISGREQYEDALLVLRDAKLTDSTRKQYGAEAFAASAAYDRAIADYLMDSAEPGYLPLEDKNSLRYGENPHQKGAFYGQLEDVFDQLHGKELSYNNLLDVDAAVQLIREFEEPTIAVIKHNNACGLASRDELPQAWKDALAGDPVSAFGGIIISNRKLDAETARGMHEIFFEVVIAPAYESEALEILEQKKKRIILRLKEFALPQMQYRSLLNGVLAQQRDQKTDSPDQWEVKTQRSPGEQEAADLVFASKICKHTKSNTIILAKNQQLLAGGTGQTSRVDALKQAIDKAKNFEFDLEGAVMASDAFFPFPDCVEIADKEGITAVIQPGGSIRDEESINYCDQAKMAMVTTGTRHFKH